MSNGKLGGQIRRSDTDLYETSQRDPMTANPFRLRLMQLLGVKYVVEVKQSEGYGLLPPEIRFPPALFKSVWENERWRIWEYRRALPRAMFVPSYVVKTNPQEIIDALYDAKTDLARTVVLDTDPQTGNAAAAATGSAQIISYGLNEVRIRAISDADGFVLLTDTYYPGWAATVDGKPANVLRADYSFRSVPVPKGDHTVVFRYAPASLYAGLVLSLMGIVGTFVYSTSVGRKTLA